MEVIVGNMTFPVEVIKKPRLRNVYMRLKDGTLLVTCPYGTSEDFIMDFIHEKERWILKTYQTQKRKAELDKEGVNGPIIYLWGEKKYVRYEEASRDSVFVDGDIITFYLKEINDERIQKAFRKYAIKEVENKINERREEWDWKICMAHDLIIPTIKVQYMTSRWGVCYPERHVIKMSSRLVHYPMEGLDYVLLHEYIHFLVRNHSSRFYMYVAKYMPNYKRYDAVLK